MRNALVMMLALATALAVAGLVGCASENQEKAESSVAKKDAKKAETQASGGQGPAGKAGMKAFGGE